MWQEEGRLQREPDATPMARSTSESNRNDKRKGRRLARSALILSAYPPRPHRRCCCCRLPIPPFRFSYCLHRPQEKGGPCLYRLLLLLLLFFKFAGCTRRRGKKRSGKPPMALRQRSDPAGRRTPGVRRLFYPKWKRDDGSTAMGFTFLLLLRFLLVLPPLLIRRYPSCPTSHPRRGRKTGVCCVPVR